MKGTKPQLTLIINGTQVTAFPPAPAWLSEAAQNEWRRMQPFLEARQYLTYVDLANLENYCVAQGRVRECEAQLAGVTSTKERSQIWRMQKQAMDAARQLGAELGLTPMSRSRPVMRSLFDDEPGDDITLA